MHTTDFTMLEMLTYVYEDMDIGRIEERFVNLVDEVFSFDRLGLFAVRHKTGRLVGRMCRGFKPGAIRDITIPIDQQNLLTRPLFSGFPIWGEDGSADPTVGRLGLTNFVLIPIVNKKRIPCWKIRQCTNFDCQVHGNQWLRCWLVPDTACKGGTVSFFRRGNNCESCIVFTSQNTHSIEGILLVDNSLSDRPFSNEIITVLSILAHAVGSAINNSKTYNDVVKVAIRDALTGLYNRRYFNERLIDEVERAKRYGSQVSLLMGDIDHFKQVNDTYGHPVGDQVLSTVGKTLRNRLRKSDVVARYGGEEFAILLLDTPKSEAFAIAEKLRRAIAEQKIAAMDRQVTVSIGAATLGLDANSFDGLVDRADRALYNAKAKGRNTVSG